MVILRRRKRVHKRVESSRTQPLRTANVNIRSGGTVCEKINKNGCKAIRKNKDVYITCISNQTREKGNIETKAYSSADIYINDKVYDINPRSKIFRRIKEKKDGVFLDSTDDKLNYWGVFNNEIKKRWIVVKIGLEGHYTVALIDQKMKKIELFDSGGDNDSCFTKRVKRLFEICKPGYTFVSLQKESLQDDDHDGYCQTWVWIWLYYRLIKEYSHTQFKRVFQPMESNKRTSVVREVHYYLIR